MDPRTFAMDNPFSGGSFGNAPQHNVPRGRSMFRIHTLPVASSSPRRSEDQSRRMVAEQLTPGGPTHGPMGLTPPPSPRSTGTTRRERQERASSRERARNERVRETQEASAEFEARVQNWVTRLMAVE